MISCALEPGVHLPWGWWGFSVPPAAPGGFSSEGQVFAGHPDAPRRAGCWLSL